MVILTACPDVGKLSLSFTTVSVEYLLWLGMVLGLGEGRSMTVPACRQLSVCLELLI